MLVGFPYSAIMGESKGNAKTVRMRKSTHYSSIVHRSSPAYRCVKYHRQDLSGRNAFNVPFAYRSGPRQRLGALLPQ